ncbi:MAG: AAA family ATPase [Bacteroidetes bacterium]|nr:AAA family ATPase [Bacteroidota bacterium]
MNKIGFKNFRRFVNFPGIEYNNINFLVGRNNSGKSTVVKALLLISDYLKSETVSVFSFSKSNIEDVNIVTYERAKSRAAKEDFIEFKFDYDHYEFLIRVSGKAESMVVDVQCLKIEDLSQGFVIEISPTSSSVSIQNKRRSDFSSNNENEGLLNLLLKQESELKKHRSTIKNKSTKEYIKTNSELKSFKTKIKDLKTIISSQSVTEENFSLHTTYTKTGLDEIIEEAIFEFSSEYEMQYHDIQRGTKPKREFANYKAFKESKFKIEKFRSDLISKINSLSFIYLGATLNKQSALFSIRDKKNALAQTISDFVQLRVLPGQPAYRFAVKWMQENEFEIGDSFEIKMHAGEAYEVLISSYGLKIPLADKGMGSIQAMLLILRLATIIHRRLKDKNDYTIIIEEPELNLHPALQSKLADLFHEVYKEYGINIIVETHSEYLIRKTQLLVKLNEYANEINDNPFCVIYFDKEMKQWKMNYRSDGKFTDDFGKGFYDESSILTLNLL